MSGRPGCRHGRPRADDDPRRRHGQLRSLPDRHQALPCPIRRTWSISTARWRPRRIRQSASCASSTATSSTSRCSRRRIWLPAARSTGGGATSTRRSWSRPGRQSRGAGSSWKGAKREHLTRAFVLYPTHATAESYANAWSTYTYPGNFVANTPAFSPVSSNYLAIPETKATTDIVVQLAVSDVERHGRTIDVTVRAGPVTQSLTLPLPTSCPSDLLDLIEVTLPGVPAGVDTVEIVLESPTIMRIRPPRWCGRPLPLRTVAGPLGAKPVRCPFT